MQIEYKLKQVLRSLGLDAWGRFQEIAAETGVNHRTISAIYHNDRATVSLDSLARICQWIIRQKGYVEGLPGILLGFRPSGLLTALAATGIVRICLGEYKPPELRPICRHAVSRDDSEVAAIVVELLSGLSQDGATDGNAAEGGAAEDGEGHGDATGGGRPVRFEHVWVQRHPARDGTELDAAALTVDAALAEEIFKQLRSNQPGGSTVIIGSQHANYLLELFVADLFGCQAFQPAPGRLPFHLLRVEGSTVPSCLSDRVAPPGYTGDPVPGIYYRPPGEPWQVCPYEDGRRDGGVVITRRDPGNNRIELALFGFSGAGTALLGDMLRHEPHAFWSDKPEIVDGREVRVFICRFEQSRPGAGRRATTREVIPLEVSLPRKRRR
jgi:transcriptional regulator with XRE-family HTH domain